MSNTSTLAYDPSQTRSLPDCPDAASRRGRSLGRRNAGAGNGLGNGGVAAPWHYQRRISTMGPLEPRAKQYRAQYTSAVSHQLLAGEIRSVDVATAHVLIDMTLGGLRDYRVTEAEIARRLPPRADGEATSKRVASDALDRLRAAGLVDWDHGTANEFYDPQRRTLLDGRWQGPAIYRLTIPADLHQLILAREAAARSQTMRAKRGPGRHTQRDHPPARTASGIGPAEERRRQAQSNAAALARLATTSSLEQGLAALYEQYSHERDLFAAAAEQFERTWSQRARGPT